MANGLAFWRTADECCPFGYEKSDWTPLSWFALQATGEACPMPIPNKLSGPDPFNVLERFIVAGELLYVMHDGGSNICIVLFRSIRM